ncbi:MAG: hypothetical protein H6719_07660 [Sandaracinaceae bacterium]|nr:hypothetical protein [Sandaracinaceae bacterium]
MRTTACLFSTSLLLLAACGDGASDTDAAVGLDATTGADAGTGSSDGGGGADAGGLDGGATDAGGGGDAGADCSAAVVDEACTAEGVTCGGPCTDACSFCNLLTCTGGVWNRVEVFPTPCFDCGDSARCVTGTQHCVHSYSDVGGEPDTFRCTDNPTACRDDAATCACLEMTLTFDECVEPNPGELEGRYFGG